MNGNKWLNGAAPALLIHCSIGSVYCWSLLKESVASQIGATMPHVEWAFSIVIFFLGMSAAFCGPIVERNVRAAAATATVCFAAGLIGAGIAVSMSSLVLLYIAYGIMGVGVGVGYLAPVKTLMLWFPNQKGLATGIAIAGFGLAKMIASPLIEWMLARFCINSVYWMLAAIYFVPMLAAAFLLRKPDGAEEALQSRNVPWNLKSYMPEFIFIWLMFFINTTCGLMLISQEKMLITSVGLKAVAIVSAVTALCNALGRLGFSSLGDRTDRRFVYQVIFVMAMTFVFIGNAFPRPALMVLMLCAVNAGYGGGFSVLPSLLADRFGMEHASKIHGLALTAWAMAGLAGNQISSLVIGKYGIGLMLSIAFYAYAIGMTIANILQQEK